MKFDFKALNDKIVNSAVSNLLKRPKNVMNQHPSSSSHFWVFSLRERNFSLKKYGESDRRQASGQEGEMLYAKKGLRVGTGFKEFLQTP